MNSPIKKLSVLINQSFTWFTNSLIELKKQIGERTNKLLHEVKYRKLLSQIIRRSSFRARLDETRSELKPV